MSGNSGDRRAAVYLSSVSSYPLKTRMSRGFSAGIVGSVEALEPPAAPGIAFDRFGRSATQSRARSHRSPARRPTFHQSSIRVRACAAYADRDSFLPVGPAPGWLPCASVWPSSTTTAVRKPAIIAARSPIAGNAILPNRTFFLRPKATALLDELFPCLHPARHVHLPDRA